MHSKLIQPSIFHVHFFSKENLAPDQRLET